MRQQFNISKLIFITGWTLRSVDEALGLVVMNGCFPFKFCLALGAACLSNALGSDTVELQQSWFEFVVLEQLFYKSPILRGLCPNRSRRLLNELFCPSRLKTEDHWGLRRPSLQTGDGLGLGLRAHSAPRRAGRRAGPPPRSFGLWCGGMALVFA